MQIPDENSHPITIRKTLIINVMSVSNVDLLLMNKI